MKHSNDKYNAMEDTLNIINGEYVSLSPDEMKINNKILKQLLEEIIEACKSDPLFCALFRDLFYGGSFYDGLKIRRPDEYDIDVKFVIPTLNRHEIVSSDLSGYVSFQLWEDDGLHVLVNEDGYLDTEKVMLWMHRILSTWLGDRKKQKARRNWKETAYGKLWVKLQRHGPAFTFRITNFDDILINFDFVPVFVFEKDQWPRGFRRWKPSTKSEFYIVPKPPKGVDNATSLWRVSFQEQEREILERKERLKPALRLLKMLERLQKCIKRGEILYFWQKDLNLIGHLDEETLYEISSDLKEIIIDIKQNAENEFLIAKYLLSRNEMKEFRAKHM